MSPFLAKYTVVDCPRIDASEVDKVAQDSGIIYINVSENTGPDADNDLGFAFIAGRFTGFGTTSGIHKGGLNLVVAVMEQFKGVSRQSWKEVFEILLLLAAVDNQ